MTDQNLADFYSNVARFEKRRDKGRSPHSAADEKTRRASAGFKLRLLRPALLVALCVFGLKGTIYSFVGSENYASRVVTLEAGVGFDRLGGWLMRPDPVTRFVAEKITWTEALLRK